MKKFLASTKSSSELSSGKKALRLSDQRNIHSEPPGRIKKEDSDVGGADFDNLDDDKGSVIKNKKKKVARSGSSRKADEFDPLEYLR